MTVVAIESFLPLSNTREEKCELGKVKADITVLHLSTLHVKTSWLRPLALQLCPTVWFNGMSSNLQSSIWKPTFLMNIEIKYIITYRIIVFVYTRHFKGFG